MAIVLFAIGILVLLLGVLRNLHVSTTGVSSWYQAQLLNYSRVLLCIGLVWIGLWLGDETVTSLTIPAIGWLVIPFLFALSLTLMAIGTIAVCVNIGRIRVVNRRIREESSTIPYRSHS